MNWGLKFLSIFILFKAFIFMLNAPVWGPVDEMSHMDYIEKFSTGHIPRSGDTIEESIFNSIPQTKNMLPPNFDGTRTTLGIANLSYEEQQPPIYYIIMAIPNKIMLIANIDLVSRIKVLRVISFFLLMAGVLLILPITKQLNLFQSFETGSWFGSLGLLFSTLVCFNNKHGLGNDILSPLLINTSILLFIRYRKKGILKFLIWACLFASFAFLTKYTNIVYVGFAFYIATKLSLRVVKERRKKFLLGSWLTFMIIPVFILLKYYIISKSGIEGYKSSADLFKFILPAGMVDFKTFLQILFSDMFDLSFLKIKFNIRYYFYLIPICITVLVSLFRFKQVKSTKIWLIYSLGLMFILALMMFVLNKYVAGVHWFAFRHYLGYHTFWFVAFFGFMPVIFTRSRSLS